MNHDLDYELKQALRRRQPSRDLVPRPVAFPWRLAVAAGLAVSLAVPTGWMQYRAYEQRKAKDELVFAVHLAAGKLRMAQEKLRPVK